MTDKSKTARIYACGGAGINLAATFEILDSKADINQATTYITYLDTSASDLREHKLEKENVHLFTNEDGSEMDGSGQYRRTAAGAIMKHTREVLQKYPAENFNIVVHSASGGSGSVIGPVLVKELVERGEQVIVVLVADDKNINFAKNTSATIKTYASFVKELEKPITVYMHRNSPNKSNTEENITIHSVMNDLLTLYSGQNKSLDSMDLENWLNYPKVTGKKPALSSLFVNGETDSALEQMSDKDFGLPMAVATLSTNDHPNPYFIESPYQCEGKTHSLGDNETTVLHFTINAGYIPFVLNVLERSIEQRKESIDSGVVAEINVDRSDVGDGGLVF